METRRVKELLKVHEMVSINEDLLRFRAQRSQYYQSALEFWLGVKDKLWITMRPRQERWLRQIELDLEREIAR